MKTKALGEIIIEDFDKESNKTSSRSSSVHITRTNDLLIKKDPITISDVHVQTLYTRKEAEISA